MDFAAGFRSVAASQARISSLVSELVAGAPFVTGELSGEIQIAADSFAQIHLDREIEHLLRFNDRSKLESPFIAGGLSGEIHKQIVASQARQTKIAARQACVAARFVESQAQIEKLLQPPPSSSTNDQLPTSRYRDEWRITIDHVNLEDLVEGKGDQGEGRSEDVINADAEFSLSIVDDEIDAAAASSLSIIDDEIDTDVDSIETEADLEDQEEGAFRSEDSKAKDHDSNFSDPELEALERGISRCFPEIQAQIGASTPSLLTTDDVAICSRSISYNTCRSSAYGLQVKVTDDLVAFASHLPVVKESEDATCSLKKGVAVVPLVIGEEQKGYEEDAHQVFDPLNSFCLVESELNFKFSGLNQRKASRICNQILIRFKKALVFDPGGIMKLNPHHLRPPSKPPWFQIRGRFSGQDLIIGIRAVSLLYEGRSADARQLFDGLLHRDQKQQVADNPHEEVHVLKVVGLGESGRAAVKLALARGASVLAIDKNEELVPLQIDPQFPEHANMQTVLGSCDNVHLRYADRVVVSPGISLQEYNLKRSRSSSERIKRGVLKNADIWLHDDEEFCKNGLGSSNENDNQSSLCDGNARQDCLHSKQYCLDVNSSDSLAAENFQVVDASIYPTIIFAMVFGSELLEEYIGQLAMASMFEFSLALRSASPRVVLYRQLADESISSHLTYEECRSINFTGEKSEQNMDHPHILSVHTARTKVEQFCFGPGGSRAEGMSWALTGATTKNFLPLTLHKALIALYTFLKRIMSLCYEVYGKIKHPGQSTISIDCCKIDNGIQQCIEIDATGFDIFAETWILRYVLSDKSEDDSSAHRFGLEIISSSVDIPLKNALMEQLRRGRQAALVLNASCRFKYILDIKEVEEKEQIRMKIRSHATVTRAIFLQQEAGDAEPPNYFVFDRGKEVDIGALVRRSYISLGKHVHHYSFGPGGCEAQDKCWDNSIRTWCHIKKCCIQIEFQTPLRLA